MLNRDGSAEIINSDPRKIQKFKYAKEAIHFIEKFSKPLLMHWNGEISSSELANIIRLVERKNYTLDSAIDTILNDEY